MDVLHLLVLLMLGVLLLVHWQVMVGAVDLITCEVVQSTTSSGKNTIHGSRTSIVICILQVLMVVDILVALMQ